MIEIRKASKKDYDHLLDLALEFVEWNKEKSGLGDKYYDLFGGDHVVNRKKYIHEIIDNEKGLCLLASHGEVVVGYAYAYYNEDFKACILDEIFLKPVYQKKGIGSEIFQKIMNWNKDQGGRMRNKSAIVFYKKNGFNLESEVYTNY